MGCSVKGCSINSPNNTNLSNMGDIRGVLQINFLRFRGLPRAGCRARDLSQKKDRQPHPTTAGTTADMPARSERTTRQVTTDDMPGHNGRTCQVTTDDISTASGRLYPCERKTLSTQSEKTSHLLVTGGIWLLVTGDMRC